MVLQVATEFERQLRQSLERLDGDEQTTLSRLASRIVIQDAIRQGIDLQTGMVAAD